MLKREYGAESNGKLPHLFIPSKTATLIPECAVKDLPLGWTVTLMPEFAVKDLPLGWTVTLMPEFAVKDLPLGWTVTLMPECAVKDLPLGRTLWWWWWWWRSYKEYPGRVNFRVEVLSGGFFSNVGKFSSLSSPGNISFMIQTIHQATDDDGLWP